MILALERLGGLFETTTSLSNAFLLAMMPQVSEIAKQLELPPPKQQHIIRSSVTPQLDRRGEWGGWGVEFHDGWGVSFYGGYLQHFETTNAYYSLQNPDEIPRFVGSVRISRSEAIALARETIKRLGIPLEKVFAEQEPIVTPPEKTRTGIVPRYRIEWLDPRAGKSVDMEINAEARSVERIVFSPNANLFRPWPDIGVKPTFSRSKRKTNPEYALKLLPLVLKAVDEYSHALKLKIPYPLNTNHVAKFFVGDNGGWPHTELDLTNGWRFIYRNSMVNGFYAPDNLFASDQRPILIKEFIGKWNMTEAEAIALVHKSIGRLNYPTNLVQINFAPDINQSVFTNIPRYSLSWLVHDKSNGRLVCKVQAEVDAEKRELKSFYYDHRAYWNKPPPIDVPIALPTTNTPDVSLRKSSTNADRKVVPLGRAFTPQEAQRKKP